MKKLLFVLSAVTLASPIFAGETVISDKQFKQSVVEEETCFKEREWQFDTFGQYSAGKSGQAGAFRDHGWGGGIGINYFFTRNIGLGVDAAWLSIREDARFSRGNADSEHTELHNFSGSFIFRLPIDSACLAPYAYVGGGFHVDGHQWASAHGGVGLEYRIKPNRLGVFADGRWTYLGDRDEVDDLNFFTARAGFRIVF